MSKYFPTKLSELELLSRVAGDDYALIVDKSDTFQSENGSTKRVTASTLRTYILSNFNFGSINNHSDVSIQDRVDGQLLRYNGQNAKWENWTHNFLTEEKDPVFSASDAAKIKSTDITNWNEAHGWGNHADEGYLTSLPSHKLTDHSDVDSKSETDGQLLRFNNTKKLWENWTHNFVTSQEADLSSVVRDTDFESAGLLKRGDTPGSYSIITDNSEKWNLAFDWGDHAQAGYLKNITNQGLGALSNVSIGATPSIDQLLRFDGTNWINWTPDFLKASDFTGSVSSGIAQADIDKWNTAYGWGDHGVEGYLLDITGESVGSLSDVILSPTISEDQLLRFDGTSWVNWTHDFLTTTAFSGTAAASLTSGDLNNLRDTNIVRSNAIPTFTVATRTTERTITTQFDLSQGNLWVFAGGTVPNPINATSGQTGAIRITGGAVSWSANFKFPGGEPPSITGFPAIIPFYVQDSITILMGNTTQGIFRA